MKNCFKKLIAIALTLSCLASIAVLPAYADDSDACFFFE